MKGCVVLEPRGLYYPGHRDWVLTRIRFSVAPRERFQIAGARGCAISSTLAPGNSLLVEEI